MLPASLSSTKVWVLPRPWFYPFSSSWCSFSLCPQLQRIYSTTPQVVFRDSYSVCTVDTGTMWVRVVCVHVSSDCCQLTHEVPTWIVQGSTGKLQSAHAEGQFKLCMDFWLCRVISSPSPHVFEESTIFVVWCVVRVGEPGIFLLHHLDPKSIMLLLYNGWFSNQFSFTIDMCYIKILMDMDYVYLQTRKHAQLKNNSSHLVKFEHLKIPFFDSPWKLFRMFFRVMCDYIIFST